VDQYDGVRLGEPEPRRPLVLPPTDAVSHPRGFYRTSRLTLGNMRVNGVRSLDVLAESSVPTPARESLTAPAAPAAAVQLPPVRPKQGRPMQSMFLHNIGKALIIQYEFIPPAARNVSTTLRQPSVEFKLGFLEFSSVSRAGAALHQLRLFGRERSLWNAQRPDFGDRAGNSQRRRGIGAGQCQIEAAHANETVRHPVLVGVFVTRAATRCRNARIGWSRKRDSNGYSPAKYIE
jgi:hypothetical protein